MQGQTGVLGQNHVQGQTHIQGQMVCRDRVIDIQGQVCV